MRYISAKYLFFKGVNYTIGHECRDTTHYSIDFIDSFRIFFICGDSFNNGKPNAYPRSCRRRQQAGKNRYVYYR